MILNKKELREKYKSIRAEAKSALADGRIKEALLSLPLYKTADILFIYCSIGSEADTAGIILEALACGKKVALPKCMNREGEMNFYIVDRIGSSLTKGAFSINEPDDEICEPACDSEKSLCIVPGLAFDKKGNRLGYGKGYYDRFLSRFKGSSVGLCFDKCLCEELPCDKYDRRVDTIITESTIYNLR